MTKLKTKYREVPHYELIITRNKIIKECGVTQITFYNWINGKTTPQKPTQEKIASILNCEVSEIF